MAKRTTKSDAPLANLEQRRQLAFDSLAALEAEQQAAGNEACRVYDAADKAFQDALAAYRKAEEVRRSAYASRASVSNRYAAARAQHERVLKNTADPRIAELSDVLEKAIQRTPDGDYKQATTTRQRQFAARTELAGLWRVVLSEEELMLTLDRIARDCGIEW